MIKLRLSVKTKFTEDEIKCLSLLARNLNPDRKVTMDKPSGDLLVELDESFYYTNQEMFNKAGFVEDK